MAEKMTWRQIKKSFPDEWVALTNYELTGPIEVLGKVIAHHSNKKTFYSAVGKIRDQFPNIAVRYTGQLVKNPEIPLLWQISNTE